MPNQLKECLLCRVEGVGHVIAAVMVEWDLRQLRADDLVVVVCIGEAVGVWLG